ncbi:hypothetical protein [Aliamphritea hakodatensis]|uniref:hypothetical protein n=1 Tax=Aliamphritea hakodatensis TaxID=2895352 RepID=UPI0022FD580A|nr:hypothetical protein [Aliamphritea hakodatensis]
MAGSREEGPVIGFIMNLFASVMFSVPTAILLWFGLNTVWAKETVGYPSAQNELFLSSSSFWILLGALICIGICFPRFFPGIMGFCWRQIMRLGHWINHW